MRKTKQIQTEHKEQKEREQLTLVRRAPVSTFGVSTLSATGKTSNDIANVLTQYLKYVLTVKIRLFLCTCMYF